MGSIKVERINAEIQRELSILFTYGIKDPRLQGVMLGVTGVKTTADLKYAKVYISISGTDDNKAVLKVLQSSAGFIRSELAGKLRIRTMPEFTFIVDDSLEYSARIEKILSDLNLGATDTPDTKNQ